MGWDSGAKLVAKVWYAVETFIPEDQREAAALRVAVAVDGEDFDLEEAVGGILEEVSNRMKFERRGAPKTPAPGETWSWQRERYRFDGRKWKYEFMDGEE